VACPITTLVFSNDHEALSDEGVVRSAYGCAAGTGESQCTTCLHTRYVYTFMNGLCYVLHNNTRQGYALLSTLKPAGYFFVAANQ